MSRVLVTGANGFIGHHLLPLLAEGGHEVHAVSRSAARHNPASTVCWHQFDLLDPSQAKALMREVLPEWLIHLAWYTTPPHFWDAPENTAWMHASIELFREFATSGGQRILGLGSCAEYDWRSGYCNEDTTPLVPATRYGRCKKELYLMLSDLARRSGVDAAWARVFFPYGPGEHVSKLVSYVATSLLMGKQADCRDPDSRRDFVYAGDTASALAAVMQSRLSGVVNIGTGVAVTIREMAEKVAARIGRPELLSFTTSGQPSGSSFRVVASVDKLRDQAHWAPAFSLDAGVEKTIDYWRRRTQP